MSMDHLLHLLENKVFTFLIFKFLVPAYTAPFPSSFRSTSGSNMLNLIVCAHILIIHPLIDTTCNMCPYRH